MIVLREGEAPKGVPLLEQGEVACWRDGRLLGFREAPAVLDAAAVARGEPARHTWEALDGAKVVWQDPAAVSSEQWRRWLADELVRAEDDVLDGVASLDDFWQAPNARLVPGPYRFGPFEATVMVLDAGREHITRLLPPGLRRVPGLGGRYVLIVAELENVVSESPRSDGRAWAYQETTPLIPCSRGLYVPELYPDAYMPIALGRETYGFPKRLARTRVWDGGADMIAEHRRWLRLRWQDRHEAAPDDVIGEITGTLAPWAPSLPSWALRLPAPVHVRQQLIAHEDPEKLRTDALVRIPFRFDAVTAAWRLSGVDLRLDPRQPVLAGSLLGAWRLRTGFRFGRAKVVRDYRRWWRR